MKVLSLFSGIGGFDIGLERAGMQTVAFCEFEPYCQAVLKRHWPGVLIYDDVRTLSADTLRRDGVWPIDVIAGGFPCQDLSYAGKRAGIEGERSGLWSEFARLIGEVRPRFAIMENVPGLLSAGHGRVLGDLAALGYDAVWDCIPASAVGAPHRRDRVWIVAHASSERRGETGRNRPDQCAQRTARGSQDVADPSVGRCSRESGGQVQQPGRAEVVGASEDVADADGKPVRHPKHGPAAQAPGARKSGEEKRQRVWSDPIAGSYDARAADVADATRQRMEGDRADWQQEPSASIDERLSGRDRADVSYTTRAKRARQRPVTSWQQSGLADNSRRQPEPGLGRMADGLAHWVHASAWLEEPEGVPRVATGIENRAARLKALGNSIVPQVAFLIGQAVMESTK